MISFKVVKRSNQARTGLLTTPHGKVKTPFFMPVATVGAVKTLSPAEIKSLGFELVLANTYHLYLRPGDKLIKKLGGIQKFTAIDLPFLTDSGGFQVFSLGHKTNQALAKIDAAGVTFKSHLDGSAHRFTPKKVLDIQRNLGVDIMMPLDDCPPSKANRITMDKSLQHTHDWLAQAVRYWKSWQEKNKPALFGIVQGGINYRQRASSLAEVTKHDLSGFALGGLAVGESKVELYKAVAEFAAQLPSNKPRYLMGVGEPADIFWAIGAGIDMFDCVLPTRLARHGSTWLVEGSVKLVKAFFEGDTETLLNSKGKGINIVRRTFPRVESASNGSIIQPESKISPLYRMNYAYANHLAKIKEIGLFTAFTKQNLLIINKLIVHARLAIVKEQLLKLSVVLNMELPAQKK